MAKNCNGKHTDRLLTCARCKEIRYCSRECQRIQWAEHKSACDTQVHIGQALDILGDKVARTFKAFVRFAKAISGYLETPAISALKLHRGKDRVETNCFLITIRAKETIFRETAKGIKGCITFKVENAEGVTMDYMHKFLDYRSGPFYTPERTEVTLAHRKGLMRIFIHDVSGILPPPLDGYTLPTDISNWPPTYHHRYDPQWQQKFYESIGQRRDVHQPPESGLDAFDFQSGENDALAESLKVPPARPSSPVQEEEDDYEVAMALDKGLRVARSTTPISDSDDSSAGHQFSGERRASVVSAASTPATSRSPSPCQGAFIEEIPSRPTSPVVT